MIVLGFFRPGIWELLVILLVVLLIFGATRLPKVGKAMGEAIRGFKKSVKDGEDERDTEKKDPPEIPPTDSDPNR